MTVFKACMLSLHRVKLKLKAAQTGIQLIAFVLQQLCEGRISYCVQALDLEEEEWEQFASGIARLAEQQERKPKDFEAFKVRHAS